MDFLATVKKRLEEMEEHARLLQAMEQSGQPAQGPKAMFQPRAKSGGPLAATQPQRSMAPPARSMVSHEEVFETPHCATEGGSPALPSGGPDVPQLQPRLIDDLHGRLDEAFLLSEVLGPPRCMRAWTDQ